MHHENFINFLHKLDVENNLLEAILEGYAATFAESLNAWAYNSPPSPVGINMPMGSYQNIMKQLPSSIGAAGGAGDNTGGGNNAYRYGEALPGSTRDIGEETKEQWKSAPKFQKIHPNASPITEKLIKMAKNHIPNTANNMYAPLNYYNNFPMGNSMGRFDVNATKMPPF
jgi:hypothetical protein